MTMGHGKAFKKRTYSRNERRTGVERISWVARSPGACISNQRVMRGFDSRKLEKAQISHDSSSYGASRRDDAPPTRATFLFVFRSAATPAAGSGRNAASFMLEFAIAVSPRGAVMSGYCTFGAGARTRNAVSIHRRLFQNGSAFAAAPPIFQRDQEPVRMRTGTRSRAAAPARPYDEANTRRGGSALGRTGRHTRPARLERSAPQERPPTVRQASHRLDDRRRAEGAFRGPRGGVDRRRGHRPLKPRLRGRGGHAPSGAGRRRRAVGNRLAARPGANG